jgi:protein-tyrosine kinase
MNPTPDNNSSTRRVTSMHSSTDRSIGAMLIDAGRIRPEDAEHILRYAKEHGTRFGDAAVALRLVKKEDIQNALAKQFDYPYLSPGDSKVSHEVVAAWEPFSRQVESLRALRSQLLLRWFVGEETQKSLAIVSPSRGDGRSHLAANLAVVFSQMGERTLLVDADLRRPRQQELFGLANAQGLSSLLADRTSTDIAQRIPAFMDLSVLTAGPTPPNPLELLGRQSFGGVMERLSESYDVIILDTPAAVDGSDFQHIAKRAHGALLVAREHVTSMKECREVAEAIASAQVRLVGGVINER